MFKKNRIEDNKKATSLIYWAKALLLIVVIVNRWLKPTGIGLENILSSALADGKKQKMKTLALATSLIYWAKAHSHHY